VSPITPRAVNEISREFYASVETLDPKHKKPVASVKDTTSQPRLSAESRFLRLFAGAFEGLQPSASEAVHEVLIRLAQRHSNDPVLMREDFEHSGLYKNRWKEKWERLAESEIAKAVARNPNPKKLSGYTGDGSDWREGCLSKDQLSAQLPKFLLSGLIPEKCLTFITGPSYHCKTWLAVQSGNAVSTGTDLWCFDGPGEAVPVIYHVPEMNAAFVRQRMDQVGIQNSEMFLVRPMETGIWALDDPRMLKSSEGRLVFLDTQGFFNPADDASDYKQALKFGQLVFNLLTNGARGVVALAHPPKYATQSKNEPAWTLENSVLGSAGYGGILRSCLRVRNLNLDLNDPNVWLYVQGLKNPGLKPFQLEGLPLKMRVPPGESPYLSILLDSIEGTVDPRKLKAFEMFSKGVSRDKIRVELKVKAATLSTWKKEWDESQKLNDQQMDLPGEEF
jgi:hypothetical protein